MERRNQFTFYRSFWEAVQDLPEPDRQQVLEAIIRYALDGKMPRHLLSYCRSVFTLCRPVLDTARKKAKAMKENRGTTEIEIEKEIKTEKEKEKEGKSEFADREESGFDTFWQLYPRKEGKQRAKEFYKKCHVGLPVLLDALGKQAASEPWKRENGRYIPLPETWLKQQRWEDEGLCEPTDRRPDEQEILAVRRLMKDE